ncbi:MAG: sulfurase [Pseudomonadota bacterium]
MPALERTNYTCEIAYLGVVTDRDQGLASQAAPQVFASFSGAEGEAHSGLTRPACVRVRTQHPEGTKIANVRQFSIISEEEMALAADQVGLPHVKPEWMGASIMVRGLPDFTYIPPSSRLQNAAGTTLVIDMENRPCKYPGEEEVEPLHPGKGKKLLSALVGRRGVTAWVEREGPLAVGDVFSLHVPGQRTWQPG